STCGRRRSARTASAKGRSRDYLYRLHSAPRRGVAPAIEGSVRRHAAGPLPPSTDRLPAVPAHHLSAPSQKVPQLAGGALAPAVPVAARGHAARVGPSGTDRREVDAAAEERRRRPPVVAPAVPRAARGHTTRVVVAASAYRAEAQPAGDRHPPWRRLGSVIGPVAECAKRIYALAVGRVCRGDTARVAPHTQHREVVSLCVERALRRLVPAIPHALGGQAAAVRDRGEAEIGRASCRERVWISEVGESVTEKSKVVGNAIVR